MSMYFSNSVLFYVSNRDVHALVYVAEHNVLHIVLVLMGRWLQEQEEDGEAVEASQRRHQRTQTENAPASGRSVLTYITSSFHLYRVLFDTMNWINKTSLSYLLTRVKTQQYFHR